ncbi:hypothetical protein FQN54_003250 [Arachnomyces sp. PD_36]|nr:hypothetical protein FQN54_003250 [Arachnomyces sp. PD_36]
MVGLKRFFNVDNLFQSTGVERNRNDVDDGMRAADINDYGTPFKRERGASDSSGGGFSQRPCVDPKYLGIEKQFEEMHEQFRSRQLTPRDVKYRELKSFPSRNPRHVDVLRALFYSQQEPVTSTKPPAYYNEDIADRNLNSSQQSEQCKYACIVSAIYQEDVADRNIPSGGSSLASPVSGSSGQSPRFNARAGSTGQSTPSESGRRKGRVKSPPRHTTGKHTGSKIVTMSEEDLRTAHKSQRRPTSRRPQPNSLRLRSSAPNLSKQVPGGTSSRPQRPTTGGRSMSSSSLSKKNILDLSIDTNLAAGKPSVKIDHCAVQPPNTNPSRQKLSPSIAEIVNSPLPVPSTSALSPKATTSSYNVEEIMVMVRQAYAASLANNQNPSFESLQNAIIREINSRDSLREVPTSSKPESPSVYSTPMGSAFRSEASSSSPFSQTMRTNLLEEGRRLADYTRRGSPLGRRGSEASLRGIPPSVLNGQGNENGPTPAPRRRRHTYAQPLSPPSGPVNPVQPFKKIHANKLEDNTLKVPNKDAYDDNDVIALPTVRTPVSPARSVVTPPADVDKIAATIPMEPRDSLPALNRTIGTIAESGGKNQNFPKKTRYHTSPFPIGRNRIPLRRSSLYKDLYDSGRLAP